MKLQYKKLFSALVALGLTSTANAAASDDINSSQQNAAWSFGVDYLIAQPIANGWGDGSLEPKFDSSAMRLEGAYELGDGRDVNLNWTHLFSKNATGVFELSDTEVLDLSEKYKFDTLNLELGQNIVTGQRSNVRIFGGLQFARIGSDLGATITSNIGEEPVVISDSYESNLFAVGPRLGVAGNYQIINNVSVVASAATALLVGKLKTKVIDEEITTELSDERTIVPGFEGKLGLRYEQAVGNDGAVSAELGYQVASYINALKPPVSDDKNFGLQGVYLSLKWTGDLA